MPKKTRAQVGSKSRGEFVPEAPTDTGKPTVTLVAPTDGATITTGSTPFYATATDDTGVAHVEFYVDNDLIVTEKTAPYGYGSGGDPVPNYDVTGLSDGSHVFKVISYDAAGNMSTPDTATVTIDNTEDPPPPAPTDSTAFGYRPSVPAGYTLFENTSISLPSNNASNRFYRNCTGGFWIYSGSNLIFVDCDFYGSPCGLKGPVNNIQFYGCRFGGVQTTGSNGVDGLQIAPATNGGTRPSNLIIQGCTFLDVTRASGASGHCDGIQHGGVLNVTIRYCYFDNVYVEHILCNGWNGTPENIKIIESYFGTRPNAGGAPIHFSGAGTSGPGANNCDAIDCYSTYTSGGQPTAASIENHPNVVNCSETGTRAGTEWPYGIPWSTY